MQEVRRQGNSTKTRKVQTRASEFSESEVRDETLLRAGGCAGGLRKN